MGDRPRPAHIAIPINILAEQAPHAWSLELPTSNPPQVAAAAIERAAALMLSARQPVICVGGGAVGAADSLVRLAERLDAPVLSSHAGKGVVPAGHPLDVGAGLHLSGGQALLAQADLMIAVGTELAWTDSFTSRLPVSGKVVRVDLDPNRFHRIGFGVSLPRGSP